MVCHVDSAWLWGLLRRDERIDRFSKKNERKQDSFQSRQNISKWWRVRSPDWEWIMWRLKLKAESRAVWNDCNPIPCTCQKRPKTLWEITVGNRHRNLSKFCYSSYRRHPLASIAVRARRKTKNIFNESLLIFNTIQVWQQIFEELCSVCRAYAR